MQISDIIGILSRINEIKLHLDTAAGMAILVELKMRLMAELSEPLQNKLKELKKGKDSYRYWDCKLSYLDDAIDLIFSSQLDSNEQIVLKRFRILRNKLLHADFVGLMKELEVSPTGREIYHSGNRNTLKEENIIEAINSVQRNQGLEKFEILANEVSSILDKILFSLAVY